MLGLVLAIISIAAMFGWEKWGRDRFLYDEVLELAKSADRGTVITEDMLRSVRVEHAHAEAVRPSQATKATMHSRPERVIGHTGTETRPRLLRRQQLGIFVNGGNPERAMPRE